MIATAATVQAPTGKTRFVVINENMLGYIDPRRPLSAGILSSKPQKGAASFPGNGSYPLFTDGRDIRPATLADFEAFRVSTAGYAADPAYEAPTA